MDLQRYSKVVGKNPREMVMLRAYPCKWGKCTFCDYIAVNCENTEEMVAENHEILQNITGELGVLDVIDSASCFDLPQETVEEIRSIVQEKNIKKMFTECHYMYRRQLQNWREFFAIPMIFRCGVETFDNDFRNGVLQKGANFISPTEVAAYFESVCLLVGIQGQTKEMVRRDVQVLEQYFSYGCINIYTPFWKGAYSHETPCENDDKNGVGSITLYCVYIIMLSAFLWRGPVSVFRSDGAIGSN